MGTTDRRMAQWASRLLLGAAVLCALAAASPRQQRYGQRAQPGPPHKRRKGQSSRRDARSASLQPLRSRRRPVGCRPGAAAHWGVLHHPPAAAGERARRGRPAAAAPAAPAPSERRAQHDAPLPAHLDGPAPATGRGGSRGTADGSPHDYDSGNDHLQQHEEGHPELHQRARQALSRQPAQGRHRPVQGAVVAAGAAPREARRVACIFRRPPSDRRAVLPLVAVGKRVSPMARTMHRVTLLRKYSKTTSVSFVRQTNRLCE
ncbi:uncharacterized protein LOC126473553 [Schistocerca serialis cubense]|uniref:uncharacterized protein LOC126473553 n=1 Tax=Schistocerca serialis cubense TaxID=2023355 RepID=UPI00214E1CAA|nr:uncharacterized protein LOC126473553 [Schistocerca serialis cubense]